MKASTFTPLLLLCIAVQRLLELRLARQNERWARQNGATEYGHEHYPLFFILHPTWMLSTYLEGRRHSSNINPVALVLFLLAQPLRYWVIRTLGKQWNTRILITPGGKRITSGPFKYMKHPNYALVALEIAAAPLTVRAWRTALAYTVLNAALLLLIRIPAEEKALRKYE